MSYLEWDLRHSSNNMDANNLGIYSTVHNTLLLVLRSFLFQLSVLYHRQLVFKGVQKELIVLYNTNHSLWFVKFPYMLSRYWFRNIYIFVYQQGIIGDTLFNKTVGVI